MRIWRARTIGWVMVTLGGLSALACVVLLVGTHLGQRADERSMWSVAVPASTSRMLKGWLGLVSVEFIAIVLVVAVLLALLRRRVSRALAALLVVAGANVTTQILKAGIPRPDMGVGVSAMNTLPSGHVTVVTSLVVATLFVVPASWRTAVAFLAAGAGTLTGAAALILRWHRPSDVIAAFGVCALFAGLALVLADRSAAQDVGRTGPLRLRAPRLIGHALAALAGAGVAGAFLISAGLVTHGDEPNALVGGVVLSAIGVSCAGVVAVAAWGLDALAGPASSRSRTSRRR